MVRENPLTCCLKALFPVCAYGIELGRRYETHGKVVLISFLGKYLPLLK
jgi:hypothetical protein